MELSITLVPMLTIYARLLLLPVFTNPRQRPSSCSINCSSYLVDEPVTSAQSTTRSKPISHRSATQFPSTQTQPSSSSISSAQTLAAPRDRHRNEFNRFRMSGLHRHSPLPSWDRYPSELVSRRKRPGRFCLQRIWLARGRSRLQRRCCIGRGSRATATWLLMEFVL